MTRERAGLLDVRVAAVLVSLAVILIGVSSCNPKTAGPPAATPAVAVTPPAAPTEAAGYMGAETCKGCHAEAFEKFSHTKMGRLFLRQPRNTREGLGCETCHGPGKAHVEAGGGKGVGGMITFAKNDKTPVDARNAICLTCHTKGNRVFWKGSPHESRDVACTNCHHVMDNHSAKAQLVKETEIETCGQCHIQRRAQQMRSSHMPLREGKMTCTSCHNPHGTVTPSLLKEASLNDTCWTCHAEKRGPYLWEHPPVVESCVNCHDPHGSNHEKMLKISKPRLCQQCHNGAGHPSSVKGNDTASLKYVLGRACTDCHVNIHGSNHPAGATFTR